MSGRIVNAHIPSESADHTPLYIQIKEDLVGRIERGEWRAGDVLPSEQNLSAEYGVAPGTMRKAIEQLVADNLLLRQHGKGTYVTTIDWRSKQWGIFRLYANDGSHDRPPARLLHHRFGVATDVEASKLALAKNAKVLRATRVRLYNNEPVVLEKLVIPLGLFAGLEKDELALPSALYIYYAERYGIFIVGADEALRAVSAGAEEKRHLKLKLGHPLLQIERIAYDIKGRPVEWRESRCDTSHHYYRHKMG